MATANASTLNWTVFMEVALKNLLLFLPTLQPSRKFITYSLEDTQAQLRAEIGDMKRELAALKQEKAALELLLLTTKTEANKRQIQEMPIAINLDKIAHQVAEITQTDYFQQLQAEVESLRNFHC